MIPHVTVVTVVTTALLALSEEARLSKPAFERRRDFHERGPRDGWDLFHARDMASGQEEPTAQTDETFCRAQDGACCVSRSGQENPIQARPARLPPLPRNQTRWSPLWTTGSEGTPGVRSAWRASACWPGRGSFSRQGEARRSGPPQSKDDHRQRRSISCACGFTRQANERTRMRLVKAWQTPAWHVLVRQIQLRNI